MGVFCDVPVSQLSLDLTPVWSSVTVRVEAPVVSWPLSGAWHDGGMQMLSCLSCTPRLLPLPDWAFTTCLASNNKSWPHPFYFCHDYSLTNQAGPGLPSERLDLTNIPHWMRNETKVCSVGTSDFVLGRLMDRALKHAWWAWKRFKGQRLPVQVLFSEM